MRDKRITIMVIAFVLFLSILIAVAVSAKEEYRYYVPNIRKDTTESDNTFTMTGILLNEVTKEPVGNQILRLAEVYRSPNGDVFVLDDAFSPGVKTDLYGYFKFENVMQFQYDKNPAEYVIVAQGGVPYEFDIIEEGNHPTDQAVWAIPLGTFLHIGKIETSFSSAQQQYNPSPLYLEIPINVRADR